MEKFKIYIDRLKNGHVEKFVTTTSPAFLEIDEDELTFHDGVQVKGEAYLADDHLVAHVSVTTSAFLPCSICNTPVRIPISIKDVYTTPLAEIHSAIYDLTDQVRETILLQIPLFAECHEGKCPEREEIKKFFNMHSQPKEGNSSQVHFPFADLE